MKDIVLIEKISIENNGILTVKPKRKVYDKIYRSAMGVSWNFEIMSLYFVAAVSKEEEIMKAYRQIIGATENEYGDVLTISSDTLFVNIEEAMQNKMLLCGVNGRH